jgi:ATP-binding cassette subfamily F protein 3
MRVALARALFVEPDILLLDEPTNHLDLHAVLWLEAFLQRWTRTLVVVSHSRSFLNEVCTEIIHLQNKKLEYYDGNYDMFETTRFDRLKQQQREFDAQQSQREHIMSFVNKFRASAARAKMAQSRLKMLDRMEMIAPIVSEAGVTFEFPQPDDVSGPMVQIIDCEFGYKAGQTLFRDVNFGLDSDSRIALVGANGTGKSTFMKVVLGTLEPRRGQVVRNPKIRVGHFAQHHLEQLTPQQTALEFMRAKFPEAEEGPLRAQLCAFGLSGDRALQPIYTLSGGQKSRLALAWITLNRPHLLLLDEPTNHLDIDTVTALLQALMSYKGGILVVSHDESFITSLCDQIHVAHDGKLERYHGEFEQYRQSIAKEVKI